MGLLEDFSGVAGTTPEKINQETKASSSSQKQIQVVYSRKDLPSTTTNQRPSRRIGLFFLPLPRRV